MRIPIAKEGYIFIIPLALLTLGAWLLGWTWATCVIGLLFIFVLSFFRDPEREIPTGPNLVVSPADGKVVVITTEDDPFNGKKMMRISIFLNVFNVHVNRVPVAGEIVDVRYNHGKFMNAFNEKASMDNEQNALLMQHGETAVVVKQIAGLIARRIVCWARPGDRYDRGQRFGLIRFGSRVDIMLPEETQLNVKLGDQVRGGKDIIGTLPEN